MFERFTLRWHLRNLSSNDWRKREAAANELGEKGSLEAFEPLVAALADPTYNVRRSAAKALGQLGDQRAIDPLIELLGDEDSSVRKFVASALAKLGEDGWRELIRGEKEDLDRLGSCGDQRAVKALVYALKLVNRLDERSFLTHRKAAARALVQITSSNPSFLKNIWQDIKGLVTTPHSDTYASGKSGRTHHDMGVGLTFPDEPEEGCPPSHSRD